MTLIESSYIKLCILILFIVIYNFDMNNNYSQINRIVSSSKFSFLKGLSITERRLLRKMFLQLKMDILSGDNQGLEPSVRKRIKKDLEKQLETFDKFYKNFRRTRTHNSRREMKIFEGCLRKSLRYYSFLILIWEENEILI